MTAVKSAIAGHDWSTVKARAHSNCTPDCVQVLQTTQLPRRGEQHTSSAARHNNYKQGIKASKQTTCDKTPLGCCQHRDLTDQGQASLHGCCTNARLTWTNTSQPQTPYKRFLGSSWAVRWQLNGSSQTTPPSTDAAHLRGRCRHTCTQL